MSAENDLDIAVIGVSCEFGGAADLERYWQAIAGQRSLIRTLDAEEARERGATARHGQDGILARMAAVPNLAGFDHARYGVSQRDAEIADPQLRLMFRHASQALASGGCDPQLYEGSIGLFGSVSTSTEWANAVRSSRDGAHDLTLNEMSYVDRDFYLTRLAYALGLEGPVILLNTACSSSLVALHAAVQSLLAGDCDQALVGACSLRPFWAGYPVQEGGIFSPTGECVPFSAQADGTVPGEGAAFLLLKPLGTALADGDAVFCIIKGSAVNNDGANKPGYAAPSAAGQSLVIEAALVASGVAPETLAYVECHGTGTRLGDPVEVVALDRALRLWGRATPVAIGSVKATIGHTDVAAGIAGVIKAALILRQRLVPPQIGIGELNPLCKFEHTLAQPALHPVVLDDRPTWCAGVSSFGVGGTNAHVVIAAGDRNFPLSMPAPATAPRFEQLLLRRNAKTAASGTPALAVSAGGDLDIVLDILRRNGQMADIDSGTLLAHLGIDSIAVLMITEELQARFGAAPTPAGFIELATVGDLVAALGERPIATATPAPVTPEVPDESGLTFGQRRFFYPQAANPLAESYAAVFQLGAGIGPARVKAAVAATLLHHQALRSRFIRDGEGHWRVRYEDYPADGYFAVVDVPRHACFDVEAYCRTALATLEFTRAPLFFARLIRFADHAPLLALCTHHVIYDGHTLNIVLQDLLTNFQHDNVGAALVPATPVAHYVAAQQAWYRMLDWQAQDTYWRQRAWSACRPLPVDSEAGVGGRTGDEAEHRHTFDAQTSTALMDALKRHKIGMLDLIVHAVSRFYLAEAGGDWLQMSCAFGGRADVIGKQEHDYSRTAGLLALNGLLLLRRPEDGSDIDQIFDIKRQLAAVPARGLAYFIEAASPEPEGAARRASMPAYDRQIGVNFLGYESPPAAAPTTEAISLVREIELLPPDLERWYRLDFDFGFLDGRLWLACRYARSQYRADTIARYVHDVANALLSPLSGA